jgi:hypothetical protein
MRIRHVNYPESAHQRKFRKCAESAHLAQTVGRAGNGRHKPAILGHWIGETRGRSNGSLRLDTGQSRPEHDRLLGVLANCQDARFSIWTAFPTNRHDRRLVEDDAMTARVDLCVRSTGINRQIV